MVEGRGPRARDAEEAGECLKRSGEEQTVSTAKGKVLVIDDEADIRESLDALLSLEGYEVDWRPMRRKARSGWNRTFTIWFCST